MQEIGRAPDSLVPVRMTDLLDERSSDPRPKRVRSSLSRTRIAVLASFVAGGVGMFGLQSMFPRKGAEVPHAAPSLQAAAAVKVTDRSANELATTSVAKTTEDTPPSGIARAAPSNVPEARPEAELELASAISTHDDSAKLEQPSAQATTPGAATQTSPATSANASVDDPEHPAPPPHRKRRSRASVLPGYQPPTAEFPN